MNEEQEIEDFLKKCGPPLTLHKIDLIETEAKKLIKAIGRTIDPKKIALLKCLRTLGPDLRAAFLKDTTK